MKYVLLYEVEYKDYNTSIVVHAENDSKLLDKLEEINLGYEQPETRFNVYEKDNNGYMIKRDDLNIITGKNGNINVERSVQTDE